MNRVEKILCPIDLKEDNDKVLITAASVARAFQAELVLAYITPKFLKYSQREFDSSSQNPFMKKLIDDGRQKLEEVLSSEILKGISSSVLILSGSATEEILKAIEQQEVDLVIMGTSGKEGWDHFILGSVAQNVIRGSNVPVMTVKPE